MIELAGCAFGGFIAFLILLAKQGPFRPGDRGPEILLAICSAIALVFLFPVVAGNDPAFRSREAALGAAGRVLAFYAGTACAYFAYRLFRRAKPMFPRPTRSLERPRMSPEYEAADRRMDDIFEAMKADALRGPPSSGDPRIIPSYAKMIDEAGEALLQASKRESPAERAGRMAAIGFIAFAVLYALFVILTT
jgi:hypothetical protein